MDFFSLFLLLFSLIKYDYIFFDSYEYFPTNFMYPFSIFQVRTERNHYSSPRPGNAIFVHLFPMCRNGFFSFIFIYWHFVPFFVRGRAQVGQ